MIKKHGNATHGMSDTDIFDVWTNMLTRCFNPKNPAYPYYGGRGITVCRSWTTFANFYRDMGKRPEGMTLDRINSDGHYEPENCRWATRKTQSRNRRNNIYIVLKGRKQMIKDWAAELKIKEKTILNRYHKNWPPELILSTKMYPI